MHNRSQHHSITNNMVESVKKDEEREKLAEGKRGRTRNTKNLKQLSTKLLGTHYWASLSVRGDCDLPSVKTDFIFPHHTHSKRMLITLLLSSSRDGRMVDALLRTVQRLDQSWKL